ncbi:reverse transcriptase domain-containing protein [Tanacetum coccineum]
MEKLAKKSIHEKQVAGAVVEEENSWMTPIIEYLVSGILPKYKKLARKVRVKAPNYKIIDGILYKRSFLTPWLRYVGPKQAKKVIREIHGGSCGLHAGPRSLVAKITTLGLPKQDMISVTAAWPFIKWGIDIVGPLREALRRVKFLTVAVDYFTKWVEAKPLASVTREHVERFVWEHIVFRFGIPQMIVSDNKTQFEEGVFPQFCEKLKIKQAFTSVYHPQGWIDELPHVLWAHRTSSKKSNGESPFSLTYGTEAFLPIDFSIPTKRTRKVDPAQNEKDLRINLEVLEERRDIAAIREAAYKKKLEQYYNKKVRTSTYKPEDYVLRLNSASKVEYTRKMGPA